MGYTRQEMETHIVWDDDMKTAQIYSASPVTMRKLDKLCAEFPDVYKCVWTDPDANYPAKKYEVSAKFIRFGKPASEARKESSRRNALQIQEKRRAEAEKQSE